MKIINTVINCFLCLRNLDLTPAITRLPTLAIPIPPPPSITGAAEDVRTCVTNASYNISNVKESCPAVRACCAAMSKANDGYLSSR